RAAWRTVEGEGWGWEGAGARLRGDAEWAALGWQPGATPLAGLRSFVVEVTVSGQAEAAGLSFGPFRDFMVHLEQGAPPQRLQVEVDQEANRWVFRADGVLMGRAWWDADAQSAADLAAGALTLKGKRAREALFQDLTLHLFAGSCRLSVIVTCHRFLQRLRLSLRNWCGQTLPAGTHELLVANPASPDGAHEHLAAVARSYPTLRLRELALDARLASNKGAMINQAVRASGGEWIWLTDADCLFGADSAARVLEHLKGRRDGVFYGQRRHLTPAHTDGLIAGRYDGLRDFAALAAGPHGRAPDAAPWGYTQIIHRSLIESLGYREHVNHFAHTDEIFVAECRRRGIKPEPVPDLFCLHLHHPFAWYGTNTFL
ncbi:MAG: glycosyltransferase family 2 protein, partial [Chloroflexales bacterium]|nr:glycosyltransferase family 2 protein [Chloroflexales bacterium]